jgi:hypothetical protein
VPLTLAHAQSDGTAISGDEVCGGINNKCTITHIGIVIKRVLGYVIALGLPVLVVVAVWRFVLAWFALRSGNANAYNEALKKSGNAIVGFLFIVALFAGLMLVLLKFIGVQDAPLNILKIFSEAFVAPAYAAQGPQNTMLPNFLRDNNLYDLILSILRLVMRFFIYPMIIVAWVWTGVAFVLAQGNPVEITKAKKWLVGAFITTLAVFMIQAFLTAARGTVMKILPAANTQQTGANTNEQYVPNEGDPGAACVVDGVNGQMGNDKVCRAGRGGVPSTSQPSSTGSSAGSGGGDNYDSRVTGVPDVPCGTRRNGGRCRVGGVAGSCSDFKCIPDTAPSASVLVGGNTNYDSRMTSVSNSAPVTTSYIDECLNSKANLNDGCTTRDNKAGFCKFNISTNKFICIADPMVK